MSHMTLRKNYAFTDMNCSRLFT